MDEASIFEALMIGCFGLSWPISIAKSLKTKVVVGKCPMFMGIVLAGYACGITHKVVHSMDMVIALYIFNFIAVAVDLFLYYRYLPRSAQPA